MAALFVVLGVWLAAGLHGPADKLLQGGPPRLGWGLELRGWEPRVVPNHTDLAVFVQLALQTLGQPIDGCHSLDSA